jgi:uncharacterized protein YndB with AHSA1/START domain
MTKAAPESSDSLVFECDFEEPPEKVWRALTEPRLLDKWLTAGESPRTDFDEGQPASRNEPSEPRHAEHSAAPDRAMRRVGSSEYEIVTAEPHRLLRYRWRDRDGDRDRYRVRVRDNGTHEPGRREVHSVVTFELAPGAEGGTHLRLTHGEFRIVSMAPSPAVVRVRPITSARRARMRRTEMVSLVAQYSWRRAA